jgi:cyclopropane fatty-acyl-phospholipid synthase-like methyltransferase
MSVAQQQIYSAPFDSIAARYDATFTHSRIGQAQRASVWHELDRAFPTGSRVLEIGCGTGYDACHLARRGVEVVACDSSPEMIAVATARIQSEGLQKLVQPKLLRAEDIFSLQGTSSFDGVFSNFGALNCVPDIGRLARDLAALLAPGGSALLCWMGSSCAWETLWYLGQGEGRKAFRRLQRDGVPARLADGAFVHVHYPSVSKLTRSFAPAFKVKSIKGIGIAVPPSYVEPWARRHPGLLNFFERTDSVLGRFPGLRLLGDHVLVRLQREIHDVETAAR